MEIKQLNHNDQSINDESIVDDRSILLEDCAKLINFLKAGNKVDVNKAIKYLGIFNLYQVITEIIMTSPISIKREKNEEGLVEYSFYEETKYTNEEVLDLICSVYNVNANDIKTRSRKGMLNHARQLFCFIAYFYSIENSFEEIGRFIGRHHATVLHARDKVRDLASVDENYKKEVIDLMQFFKIHEKYLRHGVAKKISIIA